MAKKELLGGVGVVWVLIGGEGELDRLREEDRIRHMRWKDTMRVRKVVKARTISMSLATQRGMLRLNVGVIEEHKVERPLSTILYKRMHYAVRLSSVRRPFGGGVLFRAGGYGILPHIDRVFLRPVVPLEKQIKLRSICAPPLVHCYPLLSIRFVRGECIYVTKYLVDYFTPNHVQ